MVDDKDLSFILFVSCKIYFVSELAEVVQYHKIEQ